MEALTKAAEDLVKSGDQESGEAKDKVASLQQQWSALIAVVESRVKLAKSYVSFHKKAQQVCDFALHLLFQEFLIFALNFCIKLCLSPTENRPKSQNFLLFVKLANGISGPVKYGQQYFSSSTTLNMMPLFPQLDIFHSSANSKFSYSLLETRSPPSPLALVSK